MAPENVEEQEIGSNSAGEKKPKQYWIILALRLVAFLATASATIVMALNKETKTLVVATIGSTPVKAALTAKFQHTPAFVFFVIANGIGSVHNLVMIMVEILGHKFDYMGLRIAIVAILDMMTAVLVSGAASAAAFMAEVGKNGNSHAGWNKICDKFDSFCDHGAGALVAAFSGLGLLLIIAVISIIKILNLKPKP